MGPADSDIEQGGSGFQDIGTYLFGGGAIGHAVRVRYMVPDATHEEGFGRIPTPGGPQADGAATVEGAGRRMDLPPSGGYDGGGGFAGGGNLLLPSPEHSSAIYCN